MCIRIAEPHYELQLGQGRCRRMTRTVSGLLSHSWLHKGHLGYLNPLVNFTLLKGPEWGTKGGGGGHQIKESKGSLFSVANLALGLDTIPCLLSLWSEWSDCSVTCGKGMRTRQRMLKSLAELGDCNEELEQVEKCMLPECRKSWSSWEPPLLLLTRPACCSYC